MDAISAFLLFLLLAPEAGVWRVSNSHPRMKEMIKAARSCVVSAGAVEGRAITTLEGLGSPAALHPVQAAFIAEQAAQCGYCLNGMVVTAVALLRGNPHPTEADIREALRYNLCRCGAHVEILRAVQRAAGSAA